MDWEGKEALEHREANDAYFGVEADTGPVFENDPREELGFEDGLDGIYQQGQSLPYEAGWERGDALRRLRNDSKAKEIK